MAKITDLNGEWASAIGQAFVAFGSIEHVTIACLKEIPKDRIQRSTKMFKLTQRIDLILELLESHSGEEFTHLIEKLNTAKELARVRNLIAHNPLFFEVYEKADGEIFQREVIVSLQNEKKITLPELQEFSAKAEALASELYFASAKVFNRLDMAKA